MTYTSDKVPGRRRRFLRLSIAVLVLAGAYVLYRVFSTSAIPTCGSCTLTVPRSMIATATGTVSSMPHTYQTASVILDMALPSKTEIGVAVPLLNQQFTYSVGTLTQMPVTADLCLYFKYGNSHPCDKVSLTIVVP
jgi:hypothetical protein